MKLARVGIWVCLRLVRLSLFRFGFMGLFLSFIYGLDWFLGFISCFYGFDGVDLVAGFGFRVCWRLVYFMDLGRTRRTSSYEKIIESKKKNKKIKNLSFTKK